MDSKTLIQTLSKYSVVADEKQANQLLDLMHLTLQANKVMNLTAITEEDDFLDKMIIDSAIVFKVGDIENKNVLDVGSGAGFPGLVLSILYPDAHITCLDSTKKKCLHIQKMIKQLELKNCEVVNARAEDYARSHRHFYDVVISRAVASLDVLCELCGAFVRIDGQFIAMKAIRADEELADAENAIKVMGLRLIKIEDTTLPLFKSKRYNIFFFKKKACLKKYPRLYKEIKARPL